MADEDYYQVLGVSKNASEEEIQKSYRKLARKYHPDLHADEDDRERDRAKQQFQKVQQAYDVLSDAEKRQKYDHLGPSFDQMGGGHPFGAGGGGQFGPGGIDMSQIFGRGGGAGGFEDILRQMGGGHGGPGAGHQRPTKGGDVNQEIVIPFATAVMGGQHQVSVQTGDGKVEKISVKIPEGIESNKKIRLRGQGQEGAIGGPRGDMMITVNVAPHPVYVRKGLNLMVTVPITLLEAANGAKVDLPTPHGIVSLTVPAASSSGKQLRLKGMGIKTKTKSGDLIATLQIVLPESISAKDLDALNQLGDDWNNAPPRNDLAW